MNYAQFAQIANQMLTSFGVSATLSRQASGPYNPATASASITTTNQTVTVVTSPYPAKMIDGTMIQSSDLQVFVGTSGVTSPPEPADTLTVGGTEWTVISVKTYNPAGTTLLYELQVRQ